MDGLDFSKLVPTTSYNMANSISEQIERRQREQQQMLEQISEHNAKKDKALFETAEASMAQKELMEQQLDELKSQNDILAEQLKEEQVQKEILEEHLKLTTEQNDLLSANYEKLEAMYNAQKESYEDAQEDVRKSRVFNAWMMVISVVAMFAAIASPIVTIIVSR